MSNLKTFPQAPYFDDLDGNNGFMQILFRPSFPVQTRELNQLQTLDPNEGGFNICGHGQMVTCFTDAYDVINVVVY